MKYIITEEHGNLILAYLIKQPYKDVANLVAILRSMEKVEPPVDQKLEKKMK